MSVFLLYYLVFSQSYNKSLRRHSGDTSVLGLSHIHLFLASFTQVGHNPTSPYQLKPHQFIGLPALAKCYKTELTYTLQFFLHRQAVTLYHIEHSCHLSPPSWWMYCVSTLCLVLNHQPVWITDLRDSFLNCARSMGLLKNIFHSWARKRTLKQYDAAQKLDGYKGHQRRTQQLQQNT